MGSHGNTDGMQRNPEVLPILEMINTALDGSVELLRCLYDGDLDTVRILLGDLGAVISAVTRVYASVFEGLPHSCIPEQLENVSDTLGEIESSLKEEGQAHAKHLAEYQLLPFFRLLYESFYFWGKVYPDPSRMKRYYQEEFAQHYRSPYYSPEQPSRFRLSIVVAAYNHLETTKTCVEHILKYADFQALQAELILIDHGSTDGTMEYFRSIPHVKVIHFKRNVRMYMFAAIPLVSEGEYINFVSNDILVTKNWAQNLIACMESDKQIAAAVPMTPNISNLQMLSVPTDDPEKFVQWADEWNQSNPILWSDRARLMPPTCMYRMSALCELGLADPYFYSMEYWDDDFSLRARRAGYRQILCEDTACYHFGSVTGKDAQKKEGTLQYGRNLFQEKNQVDAWGNGFCYDYQTIQLVKQCIAGQKQIKFLGIDCGFGDTPLQIRNELRRRNGSAILYNLTTQTKYAPDLQPLSDYFQLGSAELQHAVAGSFPEQKFDFIYLGEDAGYYQEMDELLAAIQKRLVLGGCLIFKAENPWYVLNLYAMMQGTLPGKRIAWRSPSELQYAAQQIFCEVQTLPVVQRVSGTKDFIRAHYRMNEKQGNDMAEKLSVKTYYFICRR